MAKSKLAILCACIVKQNKGMGIVLEHADDLIERAEAGVTFDEFMEAIEAIGITITLVPHTEESSKHTQSILI